MRAGGCRQLAGVGQHARVVVQRIDVRATRRQLDGVLRWAAPGQVASGSVQRTAFRVDASSLQEALINF